MFAWVSRKMQAQHPNLHISYTHFSLSQAPEIIKSGKTQLIFGEDNALWQRPDVRFIPLYREEHTLVLPADHALANRPSLSLSDLKDKTFVLPSHRPWIDHLNRLCELPGGEYLENLYPRIGFFILHHRRPGLPCSGHYSETNVSAVRSDGGRSSGSGCLLLLRLFVSPLLNRTLCPDYGLLQSLSQSAGGGKERLKRPGEIPVYSYSSSALHPSWMSR